MKSKPPNHLLFNHKCNHNSLSYLILIWVKYNHRYLNSQASTYLNSQASMYHNNQALTYLSNPASMYLSNQASMYLSNQASTYLSNQASTYLSNQASTYLSNQASTYLSLKHLNSHSLTLIHHNLNFLSLKVKQLFNLSSLLTKEPIII